MKQKKKDNAIKLILPFPHCLWVLGYTHDLPQEEAASQEPKSEQSQNDLIETEHE